MLPQEIIRRKRDGRALGEDEIAFFVEGLTAGQIGEGQIAALAMAIFFRGMEPAETIALTAAMTRSGARLSWPELGGPLVDKHSTGGIGDKVSLILAPILAACGAFVPMISGRGLGHTGGTLDKLDSIPGYATQPALEVLRHAVRTAGCAIVGQTPELAPADRRLYAIRDVTATVECQPLIVSSILSKKLAAGLDALVMDVKVGSGAFLPSLEAARELADALETVAEGAGLPCSALLTDMDQCLGRTAGNALEVAEAIAMLRGGGGDPRLREVTLALAAEALGLSGLTPDREHALQRAGRALDSGEAAERFARMVAAMGGPSDLVEVPGRYLEAAPVQCEVPPDQPGRIAAIDARALGVAVIGLGGGRTRVEDRIDHAVGLAEVRGLGEVTGAEQPLAIVHARDDADAARAANAVRSAFTVSAAGAAPDPVVLERRRNVNTE